MGPIVTDKMDEDATVVATYMFRGIEYVVTMTTSGGRNLVVEVEDRLTADQWRGSFDVPYIEDLTRKTGNYKQFPIFVSMLESAIAQNSDCVSLDLLTYSDLESLRNRKAGVGTRNIPPAKNATTLNSKRYLILTYTAEFDRIHYPLPLPFMGKPDPRALQETIRQLQQEIRALKQQGSKDFRIKELEKLKRNYDELLVEKEELEAEFVEFKRDMKNTREGSAVKEIRVLKSFIKNLEEELMKEKTKYQKSTFKRQNDFRQTRDELEELRASERNLKARVKSLTNELALYKRRGSLPKNSSYRDTSRSSSIRDRSSSRENSYSKDTSRLSARSRESTGSRTSRTSRHSRDNSRFSSRNTGQSSRDNSLSSRQHGQSSQNNSRVSERLYNARNRSTSKERPLSSRERSLSRERVRTRERSLSWDRGSTRSERLSRENSLSRDRTLNGTRGRSLERTAVRSRSPSPLTITAGMSRPRFNPTAYVKEKERKKKEQDMKQKRETRRRLSSGSSVERSRKPSPAGRAGSIRSVHSSIESLSDILPSDASDGKSRSRGGGVLHNGRSARNIPSSPEVSFTKPAGKTKKILSSTPEREQTQRKRAWNKENSLPQHDDVANAYFNRKSEISEIDERLSRLQQFMAKNL